MLTQFEKMLLGIKTDNLLEDCYREIDKADALGQNSILLELSASNSSVVPIADLAAAVVAILKKNPNIATANCYEATGEGFTCQQTGSVFINVTWEGK
jgi:hypothetical protein